MPKRGEKRETCDHHIPKGDQRTSLCPSRPCKVQKRVGNQGSEPHPTLTLNCHVFQRLITNPILLFTTLLLVACNGSGFGGFFSASLPSMSAFSAFGPKTYNSNGSGGSPAPHQGVLLCVPTFPLGGNETGLRLHPATGDNVNPACSSTILSSFSLHVPVKSNKVLKEKRGGCLANHTTQKVCHFAPHPLGQSPGSRNVFLVFFPIFLTQILTIFAMYSPPHHKRGAEGAKKQSPVESPQQVG